MKKRFFSIFVVLLLSFVLIACNRADNDDSSDNDDTNNGQVDTIAPLLEVNPTVVNIEYNQEYNLMTGVTARDNVDGTITSQIQVNDGGFDNKVAGEYIITYTVSDQAGNTSTATRTIIVAEMRTTVEVNGAQYPVLYNPQLNEYNTDSFPFDLTKVTVLEQAYVDWLIENNDQRFGAYWSVVAVLDASRKLVEYRDFNTNNVNAEGSAIATHWSSGTPTGANAAYQFRWGMLANLTIPTNGYVVVFINDGPNAAGSPRAFGSQHVVDKGFDAIGMEFKFHNVPDSDKFNADKTYPVIRLADEVLDNRLLPIVNIEQGTLATEAFGSDLLEGVSVTHDRQTLTPTVVEVFKRVDGQDTVIQISEIDANDLAAVYGIRYRVEDDLGNVATETRFFRYIKAIEVAENDKVVISGREFDLKYNFHFNDQIGFEPTVFQLSKEYLLTLDGFDTLTDGGASITPNRKWYNIPWAVLAVTDADGKVIAVRMQDDGRQLTWDSELGAIKEELQVFPSNAIQMGVMSLVPEGGFVYTFQHTGFDSSPRTFGYQTLINSATTASGGFSKVEWMDINPFAEDFRITVRKAGEVVEEKLYVTINGVSMEATEVTEDFDFAATINIIQGVYIFTKAHWAEMAEVIDATGYANEYKIANTALMVTDAEGNVVAIRTYWKWTADQHGYQFVNDNGQVKVETGKFNRNNLEVGLNALVPEGGFVYVFGGNTENVGAVNFGVNNLLGLNWNLFQGLVLGNAETSFTDWANTPVNPFAEGFKVTVGDKPAEPKPDPDPEQDLFVTVNGETYLAQMNFDFESQLGLQKERAIVLTSAYIDTLVNFDKADSWPEGKNYTIQFSVMAITDSNHKVVGIVLAHGDVLTEVDGKVVVHPLHVPGNANQLAIKDLLPEGGFVYIFQNSSAEGNAIRAFGYKNLINFDAPGDIVAYRPDGETPAEKTFADNLLSSIVISHGMLDVE